MRFANNAAAQGKDHCAVSLDELAECFRVLLDDKPFNQVSLVHQIAHSQVPEARNSPAEGVRLLATYVSSTLHPWTRIVGVTDRVSARARERHREGGES